MANLERITRHRISIGTQWIPLVTGVLVGVSKETTSTVPASMHIVTQRAIVVLVSEVEIAVTVEGNTLWSGQASRGRRCCIAGEVRLTEDSCSCSAGQGGGIHEHAVVVAITDVELSTSIEKDPMGRTQPGGTGGTNRGGKVRFTKNATGRHTTGQRRVVLQNPIAVRIGDKQVSLRIYGQTIRITEGHRSHSLGTFRDNREIRPAQDNAGSRSIEERLGIRPDQDPVIISIRDK